MKIRRSTLAEKSNHIRLWDWILVCGLCLAPMTGLRVWKIGPAEVLCLLWGTKLILSRTIIFSDILKFFSLFIISLVFGSITGSIVAPDELSVNGLFTWIYLGIIACLIYVGLRRNTIEYNETLYFAFAKVSIGWYTFLFFYSRFVSSRFLGAPLWYMGRRFSGGGTNPHQIAVLLCALYCIFLRRIGKDRSICALGVLATVFLIIQTDSSTALLSIALCTLIYLYFFVADRFRGKRKSAMLFMVLLALTVLLVGGTVLADAFLRWIQSDANGMGRLGIFMSFGDAFQKSPVLGLGPGVHGRNGAIEFHNTYLEVLAAGGIIGGLVFLWFSLRIFKKMLTADWKLAVIVASGYVYGLAGFAMRRLVFWGIVVFALVIAEQKLKMKQMQRKNNEQ